ncbi:hypothetical protein L9F63_019976 [Diploptera punctata]|uniref:Uncharacterized protein n=1 Tax=Diploptera punctata TaxID=6984 RepID=A0AAD7ZTI6_DIPPU|nr:hypothetical protein L9F63_019976 [Diploptera punctata]
MSVGDRLIAIEKSQVQQQRTLQSFRFKQQDQDNLVTENEKLKDEVERLHGELKNSTVESSYLREELENKVEIINFLNTTLQNINKGREDDENSEDYKTKTQENILPLLEAVKLGDLEAMGNILDEGIDPNERDNDGWTPLHRAVESGNTMIVKMLVEHGADLFAHIHSHSGDLPIHTAAVNNKIQIINYFINNGVPVDARNYLGTTPLLAAVWDNQIATIRFLVEYCKAEINAQVYNLDNRTGLHLTALYGYDEIAKYLLVKKAYMELRTSGNCSAHEHDQDSDYNNEHCDNMSATPLHWAARYGHWNVGKMLVDNGADMYTKDGLGRTPQEVAQFYGHLMFVKLLEEESERLEEEYMI